MREGAASPTLDDVLALADDDGCVTVGRLHPLFAQLGSDTRTARNRATWFLSRKPTLFRRVAQGRYRIVPADEGQRAQGDSVRQRRSALGLTQGALAVLFGVATGTVKAWEAGRHAPPPMVGLALTAIESGRAPQTIRPSRHRTSEDVRRVCAAFGWTHQELADVIGVSKTAVGNWAVGRHRPSAFGDHQIGLLLRVAEAREDVTGWTAHRRRGEAGRLPPTTTTKDKE